jgi:hypothetical protein
MLHCVRTNTYCSSNGCSSSDTSVVALQQHVPFTSAETSALPPRSPQRQSIMPVAGAKETAQWKLLKPVTERDQSASCCGHVLRYGNPSDISRNGRREHRRRATRLNLGLTLRILGDLVRDHPG